MRPMTETRKRRLSDTPQLLANKRLTNGCGKSKTDHVTTRSQAKNDATARVSPARKVKRKVLTTEERRLMISMRLRHEEKNTIQVSHTPEVKVENFRRSSGRLLSPSNGKTTNGFSSSRLKSYVAGNKVRSKMLLSSFNDHHNHQSESEADRQEEAKAKKRRSALWVLNCEAEEFLFGETAAEEREVELPPISSPPRKRRRMRATELGDLLKETPLLESKLRHAPTSESEASDTIIRNVKRKEKKTRGSRTKGSARVSSRKVMGSSFSKEEHVEGDEVMSSSSEYPNVSCALLEAASTTPSALYDSSLLSVRTQRILDSIQFTFFFESVPKCELWYRTFCYQDRPRNPFTHLIESPVILPYEAKGGTRCCKKRIRKPPRKSPRCHASTQAILSSLKPTRSSKASPIAAPSTSSLSPPDPPLPMPSSKSKQFIASQHTPLSSRLISSSTSTTSSHPANVDNLETRNTVVAVSPSVTCVAPNAIPLGLKVCEISATQYLWDCIQFLSDAYVINVLSQSPRPTKPRFQTNLKQMIFTRSNLEMVIEKGLKRNHVKPLKLIIPSPKTSPRTVQNHFHLSVGNGHCSKSELTEVCRRSPSLNSPTGMSRVLRSPHPLPGSPPISPSSLRKSLRKSSGGFGSSEVSSNLMKHSNLTKYKLAGSPIMKMTMLPSLPPEEEVLFTLSEDSLPDFPWETLN